MGTRDDELIEKLKSLPPQRRAEVEDLVDLLKSREDEQRLTQSAAQASEPAFRSVWDNPDDADYDRLAVPPHSVALETQPSSVTGITRND